jgi:hypothetical protein
MASKRCEVRSSITGEQCRDVEGHREYDANRFHRFEGAVGSNEKRLAHKWWHDHWNACDECKRLTRTKSDADDMLCEKGRWLWVAMETHGCTWKSWCALEADHGLDCLALDELAHLPEASPQSDPKGVDRG